MTHFLEYRSQYGEDFIYLCAKEVVRNHRAESPQYDAENFPVMHGFIDALKKDELATPRYSAETMISMTAMEMWLDLLDRVEVLQK
jgi:hypothetical protein